MAQKQNPAGPSHRQQRVAELIRHAIAEVLQRGDIQDAVLSAHVITVPEVRMSPDLKLATAYIMPLGGLNEAPVIAALERNKKALRQEVARRVNLKFAPDLRFLRDETFDEADRIDALLRTDKVRRDLESPGTDEATDEAPHAGAGKPAGAPDPDAA
ncbi:30S ribosome-binding factor RbfA [Methylobacterium sp.]|jgi:ribosome-binding factor A|uniref:30S ribosome-binding factor RbfA n=1 Tax=Methylobacterium sp. TaxID=409 RepID=UPI002617930B|nr:30S ribosome-binding factor RbfA [Methylobacterium sp.]MDB5645447.1 ribosome-binding factor RbfA [Methylobacterium sp.]